MRLFVFAVAIYQSNAFAQETSYDENGIYLTREDFENDVLAYGSTTDKDELRELKQGGIQIIRDNIKTDFKFGEFYGYKAKGYKYFSFGRLGNVKPYGYYQILDTSGLIIYLQRVPFGNTYLQIPYFSVNLQSEKFILDGTNLKKVLKLDSKTAAEIKRLKSRMPLEKLIDKRTAINQFLYQSHSSNFPFHHESPFLPIGNHSL